MYFPLPVESSSLLIFLWDHALYFYCNFCLNTSLVLYQTLHDKLEDNKEPFARCSLGLQILYIFIPHNFSSWDEEKHWIRCLLSQFYFHCEYKCFTIFRTPIHGDIQEAAGQGPGFWAAVVSRVGPDDLWRFLPTSFNLWFHENSKQLLSWCCSFIYS